MSSPMRRAGDALVVFDGQRRLVWRRDSPSAWNPVALWPNEQEIHTIERHLLEGRHLLVIIDSDTGPVPLLTEEAEDIPVRMRPFLGFDGDLPHLTIPLLDWLPPDLRSRGHRFQEQAARRVATVPAPLLPDLLIEEQAANCPVRFARKTSGRALSDHHLTALVATVFADVGTTAGIDGAVPGPRDRGGPALIPRPRPAGRAALNTGALR